MLDPHQVLVEKKRHIEAFLEKRRDIYDQPLENIHFDRIAVRIPEFLRGSENAIELCLQFGDSVDTLNPEYYPEDWYTKSAHVCMRMVILARDKLSIVVEPHREYEGERVRTYWGGLNRSTRVEMGVHDIVKKLVGKLRKELYAKVPKYLWDTTECFEAMRHTEELENRFILQFQRMYGEKKRGSLEK